MNWADRATIERILKDCWTIAVVGLSSNPARPSYRVASYMKAQGYRVIPVNPNETNVLGERAYPSLTDVPNAIDFVDIFRKAEDVLPIQGCLPSSRLHAPVSCGNSTISQRTVINHAGSRTRGPVEP